MSLLDRGENALPENCRRLVVLGSSKVGKSAIVSRFLYDQFDGIYTPTVENFYQKIYKIRGETYRLDILDTSGFHPFPAMRRLSYVTADLFLLVYDVSSRESFEEAKKILQQLQEYCSQTMPVSCHLPPPLVLVGNKFDLAKNRAIHCAESLTILAGRPMCDFVETSAMLNINIDEAFVRLFELADLPPEMSPALHRKVTPSYDGSGTKKGLFGFVNRKISEACGAVHPNARRPSMNTDLLMAQNRKSFLASQIRRSSPLPKKKKSKFTPLLVAVCW
ncbi:GTP-binding protein Rhes-like [Mercenaria mercenaria]|uniref:GTP-binding protein Rhes-like n=1 Tax=Mercenaria mercenaria TaxID=6596 RepID=UPI00234F097E|nr:GTP-binding protein Rhes-like [Mercenaria mercenaria]